ncbi:MAG: hypothetical protein ACI86M_002482 [Saprospiraceae bacterium]|jgi:hypothetical protein
MKKNLQSIIAFLAVILPALLVGQVTITNSIFPVPGDTLKTIAAVDAGGFDPSLVGENLEWDLRNISQDQANETIYSEASEGDAAEMFPDADLLDKSTNQEIYYKSFNNKIVEIGRSGLDPVLNIINLTFNNDGESVLRRAPMSFGDAYDDESSFMIAAPASVIPDTLFPGLSDFIDSMRLTVETEHDDFVDSWGTLRLPGADYEVLRVKRTTSTNAILEVKAPFIGWSVLDENNPLTAALGDLAGLLGVNITNSYQFYGNDNKEILADLTYDDEGTLLTASYKGDIITAVNEINFRDVRVKTYPNPTYGDVTFELSNLPDGDYSVVLYNIIGKRLWSDKFDNNSGRLNANLSHLKKGTYLYSIVDENGRKVTTKRLMIITP